MRAAVWLSGTAAGFVLQGAVSGSVSQPVHYI